MAEDQVEVSSVSGSEFMRARGIMLGAVRFLLPLCHEVRRHSSMGL